MEELDSRHVGIQSDKGLASPLSQRRRDKGARCWRSHLGHTWGLSVLGTGSFWGGVSRMPRKKVEVIL